MTLPPRSGASLVQAIALSGVATALIASPALAHGAHVHYEVIQTPEGPTVQVSAAYDTDSPMASAQVSIYHPDNPQTPWLTGLTDNQGHFEFTPDQSGNWDIKVRQAGHGALVTMPWSTAADSAINPAVALASGTGSPARPLPQWLGLGLGVVGCLGGGMFLMRRSPQSKGVEM